MILTKRGGEELNRGHDRTLEVRDEDLKLVLVSDFKVKNTGLKVSYKASDMSDCNVFIVTVPTPTDKHNHPVLTPPIKASETVVKVLKKGIWLSMNPLYIPESPKMIMSRYWKNIQG